MDNSPFVAINHVGIVAYDLRALTAFYLQAAGLKPWAAHATLDFGGPGVALAGPNAGLRLMPGGAMPQRRHVSEAGITHLCLQSTAIESLRAAHADAQAAFHCPLIDLGTGYLYCYARDTEHNVVELEGVAPVWADATPWLAHVNVACADLPRQCEFYAALLGAAATRSPRLRNDERLDRIADLPGVELRMAWVPAGNMQVELIHYSQPAYAATTAATTATRSRRTPGASGHAYVAFEVQDLAAARAHLLACGGTLQDERVGTVIGADAEGNPLWLLDRGWLTRHGASVTQLAQPDIVSRFNAARAALQGPP